MVLVFGSCSMVVCCEFPVVIFNCIVGVLQRLARIPCFWWTFMALQTLLNHLYKFLFIQSSQRNYYISFNRKKNLMLGIWREKSWGFSKFPTLYSICFCYFPSSKLQNIILHVLFKGGGIFWWVSCFAFRTKYKYFQRCTAVYEVFPAPSVVIRVGKIEEKKYFLTEVKQAVKPCPPLLNVHTYKFPQFKKKNSCGSYLLK